LRRVQQSSGRTRSRVNCPAIALVQTKGALRDLAIWINCWRKKGPLGSGTKLRLPDDQLFEYDSDMLQSSAAGQLQKLGTLIQRNPKATFTVEGYTDSFGTFEYNLDLSQRRARA